MQREGQVKGIILAVSAAIVATVALTGCGEGSSPFGLQLTNETFVPDNTAQRDESPAVVEHKNADGTPPVGGEHPSNGTVHGGGDQESSPQRHPVGGGQGNNGNSDPGGGDGNNQTTPVKKNISLRVCLPLDTNATAFFYSNGGTERTAGGYSPLKDAIGATADAGSTDKCRSFLVDMAKIKNVLGDLSGAVDKTNAAIFRVRFESTAGPMSFPISQLQYSIDMGGTFNEATLVTAWRDITDKSPVKSVYYTRFNGHGSIADPSNPNLTISGDYTIIDVYMPPNYEFSVTN